MKHRDEVESPITDWLREAYERSDACAVPAASVILENVVAFEIARAMTDKFAGDSLVEMRQNYESFLALARKLPL